LDLLEPLLECHIVGIVFFEVMAITQQMHPAALMQPWIDIVGGVEKVLWEQYPTRNQGDLKEA
jgi:hypothetical protein